MNPIENAPKWVESGAYIPKTGVELPKTEQKKAVEQPAETTVQGAPPKTLTNASASASVKMAGTAKLSSGFVQAKFATLSRPLGLLVAIGSALRAFASNVKQELSIGLTAKKFFAAVGKAVTTALSKTETPKKTSVASVAAHSSSDKPKTKTVQLHDNLTIEVPTDIGHFKKTAPAAAKIKAFAKTIGETVKDAVQISGAKVNGLKIDESKINKDKTYQIGKFEISGQELVDLRKGTRIAFIDGKIGDTKVESNATLMTDIVTKGRKIDHPEQLNSLFRCQVTQVHFHTDIRGNELERKANDSQPPVGLYTMSAPNLKYCQRHMDLLIKDGKLQTTAYTDLVKSQLQLFFNQCLEDKVTCPVLPGFGMGAFLPSGPGERDETIRKEAQEAFAKALLDVAGEFSSQFKAITFANPRFPSNEALKYTGTDFLLSELGKGSVANFRIVEGSAFDVVQEGQKQGVKMGLLNPGDPSGITGENFWSDHEGANLAFDEAIVAMTTAPICLDVDNLAQCACNKVSI